MSIALANASFLATHSHGFLRQDVVCRLERRCHPSASSGESIEWSAGNNHSHKKRRRVFYPFCLGKIAWGELFKANARSFLAEAFGPTADRFTRNLASPELLSDIEVALWGLISPIAKQSNYFGAPPLAGETEGQQIWRCLLESSPAVANRCFQVGQSDEEAYRRYRECKENIIRAFGSADMSGQTSPCRYLRADMSGQTSLKLTIQNSVHSPSIYLHSVCRL